MQTNFSPAQLLDPGIAVSEKILRACVHCGFCTATCPTYVLLGDELDSPRGRIYLIKEMLERDQAASEVEATHLDRCLSCLSCMTTCPSGVHYMHLVDRAREHVTATYRRPWDERAVRRLLAWLLPHPARFRAALAAGVLARPLRQFLPGRLRTMLDFAPKSLPGPSPLDHPQVIKAEGARRKRVAMLTGCVQRVTAPWINEATIRLLTRHGCEVVVASGAGCCGALTHHLGETADALGYVKANVDAWTREADGEGLDAIVINASGCGTMIKDYGFLLRTDVAWAEKAKRISALARDVSEVMLELGLKEPGGVPRLSVAYHSACSLQHGQKIEQAPRRLLTDAGFQVKEIAEGHLCCGSAGTYNLLQADLAAKLGARKAANIGRTGADVLAAGNIGCLTQLAGIAGMPCVHTAELLDWATGGPKPAALS
ncbi:MAG TPA: glycolate oxidase subunit GlcF [Candidatus Cybelea sp.]|nr:glycolate oxidase subunit GlcF [Candidatus Cybelea sp.]